MNNIGECLRIKKQNATFEHENRRQNILNWMQNYRRPIKQT